MWPIALLVLLFSTVSVDAQWETDEGEEPQPEELDVDAHLLAVDRPLGQVAGVAVDSNGLLIAFHRAGRTWNQQSFNEANQFIADHASPISNTTIAIINADSGKVMEEHGAGAFIMPHGLTVDHEDNLWMTDVGAHQVFKYARNALNKPLLTLGVRGVPGNDSRHFCKPTDVAVASNGDFFVADGYCNSRVMKFDKNGQLITVFGAANSNDQHPLDGQFRTPHSLSLIEDMDLLCVADRDNERIQCFSAGLGHRSIPTGILFTKAENIGRVFAIREKEHYLIGITANDGAGQIESQLFVMDMKTGKAHTFAKGIENAHALAITEEGKLFVAQMNPNQIIQLTL